MWRDKWIREGVGWRRPKELERIWEGVEGK